MDPGQLSAFFMWCSIINLALFASGWLTFVFAADRVYRMHTRWFPMSREAFSTASYSAFGQYKVLIFIFNVVPFAALSIMT
ncbi:MAG: hypothetical protein AVO39_00355 [delta proteobacterium MLS_D]|nr:MAG: hypothetical protein AVO39_00355 [delta proteobacterium MLS_D]